jgi:hypothetical protein
MSRVYKALVIWKEDGDSIPHTYACMSENWQEAMDQALSYANLKDSHLVHLDVKLIA